MPANQPHTTQEYIAQLMTALKKRSIKDINDILADYQDYFVQSKAKGYSDTESIRRLPSPQELAASYDDNYGSPETKQTFRSEGKPSSAQRLTIFGATLAGDLLLFPILLIIALLLACFGIVGLLLIVTGPLLFIPESMLGQMDVAQPPYWQVLPTALLFISSGIAIVGVCAAVSERIYSGYRTSIVVRRWLLTGKHDDHLKIIPRVSKQLRALLYRGILLAGTTAILLLLTIAIISWFTEGTMNFPSTWRM